MKYKPCCDIRCLVGNCQIREAGGCVCVCRLKGVERYCLSILDGTLPRFGEAFLRPNETFTPSLEEVEKTNEELRQIREKLKEYEVAD